MIKVEYIDHMGHDLSVVNAARVSFAKKSELVEVGTTSLSDDEEDGDYEVPMLGLAEKDVKLINYLAKHKHISPFGHAFASFHVKAPVFVARQLVKHSFLRWNEVSRRYVDEEPQFYMPDAWRGRSADKKQGSEGELRCPIRPEAMYRDALDHYKVMIDWGICPEQARMVLPQSMMTEWHWSGSLDAFARMCALRCKPDTQYESQIVANQIDEYMSELFPVSWKALRMYEL